MLCLPVACALNRFGCQGTIGVPQRASGQNDVGSSLESYEVTYNKSDEWTITFVGNRLTEFASQRPGHVGMGLDEIPFRRAALNKSSSSRRPNGCQASPSVAPISRCRLSRAATGLQRNTRACRTAHQADGAAAVNEGVASVGLLFFGGFTIAASTRPATKYVISLSASCANVNVAGKPYQFQ